jgi:hypothetical protein
MIQLSGRRVDLLMAVGTVLVFAAIAAVVGLAKGLAAGAAFAALSAVLQSKWQNRSDSYFWPTVAIFIFIHVMGISLVQFSEPRFGLDCHPFALADGFGMWGILNWLEKRNQKSRRLE